MARTVTSPSGKKRVTASIRIDPALKAWAEAQKISLSNLVEATLTKMKKRQNSAQGFGRKKKPRRS